MDATLWILGAMIGGGALYTLLAMVIGPSGAPCPGCGARGTLRWRHVTRNGRPDLRFRDNPQTCRTCGWDSYAPLREALEAARVELARITQRIEAERADVPVQSLIHLLKYIALADRRFGEAERNAIVRAVMTLAPGRLTEERALHWVTASEPEAARLGEYVAPFAGEPEELRARLLGVLQDVAVADGKATKSERERILAVKAALGLDESRRVTGVNGSVGG